MTPTLVETTTGVFSRGLGHSQPDHGVGPLLRGPQAVPHGAMEVWHAVCDRWERQTRQQNASIRWNVRLGKKKIAFDKIPGVSTQPGCMTEKWMLVCVFASCSVITTCCLCKTDTHTHVSVPEGFPRYRRWVLGAMRHSKALLSPLTLCWA